MEVTEVMEAMEEMVEMAATVAMVKTAPTAEMAVTVLTAKTEWNMKRVGKKRNMNPSANAVNHVRDAEAGGEDVHRCVNRIPAHNAAKRALFSLVDAGAEGE